MPIRIAVTAPLEAADGAAAEFERGGLVADEKRDRGRPDEVDGALVAERGAELAAFAQAGAGLFGVGLGDGRAHSEQAVAIRAGAPIWRASGECLVRQRDGRGGVTGEQVIGHGEGELDGGVGEVTAGPGDASGLFGEPGGVGEGAAW